MRGLTQQQQKIVDMIQREVCQQNWELENIEFYANFSPDGFEITTCEDHQDRIIWLANLAALGEFHKIIETTQHIYTDGRRTIRRCLTVEY